MNILFLTISKIGDINEHDIYQDLIRKFIRENCNIYVVTCVERSQKIKTSLKTYDNCNILTVKIGNQSNCSFVEKGISTVLLKSNYMYAIRKFFKDVRFDMILYSTPPITVCSLVKKIKLRDKSFSYLMLKDIFPQNAVDLTMIKEFGLLHKYFKRQERQLYKISDAIGCMSLANRDYLCSHTDINPNRINICPNAFEIRDIPKLSDCERVALLNKYHIPNDRIIFVYGGNLGKPQGIDFLIKCLEAQKNNSDVFFLIIGGGSEYDKLNKFITENAIENVLLIMKLPRNEYYSALRVADVGLIFLDYRFTIPNFPSRMLSYMENSLPIACVADHATDVGIVAEKNNFGWNCYSNSVEDFNNMIHVICNSDFKKMGSNAYKYLAQNYSVDNAYNAIMDTYKKRINL